MDTFEVEFRLRHTEGDVEMPEEIAADALGREYSVKRIRDLILSAGAAATPITLPTDGTHVGVICDKDVTLEFTVGVNVIAFPLTKPVGAALTDKVGGYFPIPTGATLTAQNNHPTQDAIAKLMIFG